MPVIVPMPIHDVAIGSYGNIVGLRKFRYMLGIFEVIAPPLTTLNFKERVLIGDSEMLGETAGRAESVIITNV